VRDRCDECDVRTVPCKQAHDKNRVIPSTFPRGCAPVVHDGEVCLRALESLSCDAFAQSVVENDAVIPTECDFCPDDAGAP
jgi:hypothetical protein